MHMHCLLGSTIAIAIGRFKESIIAERQRNVFVYKILNHINI